MNTKTFNQIRCSILRSDFPARKTIHSLAVFGAVAALCTCVSVSAYGSPTKVTDATGGGAISADNYTSGSWTTLTGPSLKENKAGKLGTGTIVLIVPSGFEFNPGVPVTVRVNGSANAANNFNNTPNNGTIAATVTSSTITFTITAASSGTANSLTWQNIQVRPTAGTPLARGNLAASGTAGGLPGGNYGTLTEVAGAVTQLAVTRQPSTTATAGTAFGTQPQVTARDVYGNTVTSYASAVTAVETIGGNLNGTLTPQSVKPSSGVATFKGLYVTNAASGVTLTFQSDGLPAVTSSGINVGPALAGTLAMAQEPSASAIAGTAFAQQPQLTARDPYGNVVSDGTAITATETSGGNLNATNRAPTANTTGGVASFSGLYVTNAGTVTVTFTANGHSVTSSSILVSAADASKLAFGQQPTTTTAGSAISPAVTVKVQDKYGNTVTTDNSSVTVGSSTTAFTADSVLTANAASGVATFSAVKPTTPGTANTLTASDGGLAGATSGTFAVNAPSAGGVAADDFNRVNASDLGSNWTPLTSFAGRLIVTNNQAGPNITGVDSYSYWSHDTFNGDQYSQAVIPTLGNYTAVIVRADSSRDQFYQGFVAGPNAYGIGLRNSGWSTLATGSAVTWQAGDTLRLEASGSTGPVTVTLFRNGTPVLTTTTMTVIVGGSPGMGLTSPTVPGLTLDNWQGGNLSTGRLVLAGTGTQTAGSSQNLTITAKDASGNTDTNYTGTKSLIFSGAGSSANPVTAPTVRDSSGTAVQFGSPTAINFNNGVATVSGGNNGAMTLYKAETATISVSDGASSSSGSDRLTVTVSAGPMTKFALRLSSPQITGVPFTGVNTLTAEDGYGNPVGFNASANHVAITANAPLSGAVSGLSGGNQLTGAADFNSGVADLTALGIKYTGVTGSGSFTANAATGGYTGTSSSVTIAEPGAGISRDDFNRVDAANLGANWTPLSGTSPQQFLGHLVTINNQAGASAPGVDCLSYWSANTFTDDQYSQAVIPKVGYYTTLIVRADSTQNRFYEAYVTATGYGIAKYWDGSWSAPLVSGSDGIWHDGDTVRLEITGSSHPMTLKMYHNGSPVLTWTSSSASDVKTGGSPGIGIGDRDGVGLRLDAWEGGNLAAVPATRLVLTGSGTQTAGDSQNLTITAKDASGNTDTTYAGSKSLIFSGAGSSANPVTAPTVRNSSGTAIPFGSATAINFNNGVATVSGGNNGAMTLYKAETATISVTDGANISSGSDRLTVTVSARAMSKFALNLTSPQLSGTAFTGVNTLTAQDAYGNTVNFDASANPVIIAANAPLSGTISGLSGGNRLTSAGDFSSGVANLTALGLKYTGLTGSGTFTASAGSYTGTSGSVTIAAPGAFARDDFNRANAADLGGNWTPLTPFAGHLVLLNNQAVPNTGGVDCYSYWSHDAFNSDQYSQLVIPTLGSYVAVIVRASSAQDQFYQGYVSGANAYGISVRWNGSWVALVSGSATAWQAGQTVTLEAVGSNPVTLTLYQNGNPVLTTSTSTYVIAGGGPGLGGANLPLDNWQGGD